MIKLKNLLEDLNIDKKLRKYAGRYGGEPEKIIPTPGNEDAANPVIQSSPKGGSNKSKKRGKLPGTYEENRKVCGESKMLNLKDLIESRNYTVADLGKNAVGKRVKVSTGFEQGGRTYHPGEAGRVIDTKTKFGSMYGGVSVKARIKMDTGGTRWFDAVNFVIAEGVLRETKVVTLQAVRTKAEAEAVLASARQSSRVIDTRIDQLSNGQFQPVLIMNEELLTEAFMVRIARTRNRQMADQVVFMLRRNIGLKSLAGKDFRIRKLGAGKYGIYVIKPLVKPARAWLEKNKDHLPQYYKVE